MPELPEVETVRTGLSRSWVGKRIEGVDLRREGLRFPFPEDLEERLVGRTITAIRRRAKYLLIDLDNDDILLSHLGMSGKWTLDASDCEGKHTTSSSISMTERCRFTMTHGDLGLWISTRVLLINYWTI